MEIICKDSFSYPTLTEWKTYEAKFERKKLIVIDDTWNNRDFPENNFDMNWYEDFWWQLEDLQNELSEVINDIDNKEEEKRDLEDSLDWIENELDELEWQKEDLEDRITNITKIIDN